MYIDTEPIFKCKSLGCLQIFRQKKDMAKHEKCTPGNNKIPFNLIIPNSKFIILQILTQYPHDSLCHD